MTAPEPPPTRWARASGDKGGYADRFAELVATGGDVEGEARLADALLPRAGRVLDVGAGMGRVTASLRARGHQVVGIEPDAALRDQAERTYPGIALVAADVLAFDPEQLPTDQPRRYDLLVCVGNLLTFLAEDTEREVLTRLGAWCAPEGRLLAGFHLDPRPDAARDYAPEEFVADATATGWRVDLRLGSFDLRPAGAEYATWVLSREV